MRRLLESMSVRLAEAELARDARQSEQRTPTADGNARQPASGDGDAVLDSVVAQFEMLQRDIVERRATKS